MTAQLKTKSNPQRMAIIQLTRIGDLIQTFIAARDLKNENPHLSLVLIARKKFATQLNFLFNEVFDSVLLVDLRDYFNYEEVKNLQQTKTEVKKFIDQINLLNIDVSINLSFCKTSSYLNSIIKSKGKLGPYRNKNAQICIDDTWSQFIFSNVMKNTYTSFNLVDLYRKILGVRTPSAKSPNHENRKKQIVFHPFASDRKKKWGHSKWLEVVYQTLKTNPEHNVILVGGKEDVSSLHFFQESQILQGYSDRITYHIGSKNIEEIYNVLTESALFIGHDSMVGHLAAVAQTATITLSLGTVRPYETTPYLVGAINLAPQIKCFPCTVSKECELLPCHSQIPYQIVVQLISASLTNSEINFDYIQGQISPFHLENINIYKTYLPESRDLELEEITSDHPSLKSILQCYYKILWSFMLSGNEISSGFPNLTPITRRGLEHYKEGLTNLYELYRFGTTYSKLLLEEVSKPVPDISKVQDYGKNITEINQLASVLKNNFPYLASITDFYYINQGNSIGTHVIDIAKNSLLSFNRAHQACSILYELIEQSLENSVPPKNSTKRGEINV